MKITSVVLGGGDMLHAIKDFASQHQLDNSFFAVHAELPLHDVVKLLNGEYDKNSEKTLIAIAKSLEDNEMFAEFLRKGVANKTITTTTKEDMPIDDVFQKLEELSTGIEEILKNKRKARRKVRFLEFMNKESTLLFYTALTVTNIIFAILYTAL